MNSDQQGDVRGPLHGVKVLEIGGIGPNPFTGMLLADMGADVLRIDRLGEAQMFPSNFDVTKRGRAAVSIDLRSDEGKEFVLELCEQADGLIEGYRPGVMERLGLGPDVVHARNPRLTYGRMTGYGQEGPLSAVAGHDINYISIAGALGAMTRQGDRPLAPLNLVGDYGGGAMFLAFGVVCGILEARGSGQGQVIDAAMVDGAALLTSLFHGMRAMGAWFDEAGTNLLDSGAHFYEVYETSDGGHISVGAIEPQFYARLLELIEVSPDDFPQFDRDRWPAFKQLFAEVFATKTRAEWAAILEGEEACATPILSFAEVKDHHHNVARSSFVELDGVVQPAAAPRFARTPGAARPRRTDVDEVLGEWGVGAEELGRLREAGAVG